MMASGSALANLNRIKNKMIRVNNWIRRSVAMFKIKTGMAIELYKTFIVPHIRYGAM